jgi:hypothetical protein
MWRVDERDIQNIVDAEAQKQFKNVSTDLGAISVADTRSFMYHNIVQRLCKSFIWLRYGLSLGEVHNVLSSFTVPKSTSSPLLLTTATLGAVMWLVSGVFRST